MWSKLKEQIPAILFTALCVIVLCGGYAFYVHNSVIPALAKARDEELKSVREQHSAELQVYSDQTRRQIELVNSMLTEAINKRTADIFLSEEEFTKINAAKIDRMAEAIAKRVQPFAPVPQSPEEAVKVQNEQVDRVSSRLNEKLQPILTDFAQDLSKDLTKDQTLTREAIDTYGQKITAQVGQVLAGEMAKNQVLNNNLGDTQALARESLALSHELTALYLSSLKDQGIFTRLLSLPANVVKDAASLSFVNSSDRKQREQALVARMNDLQKRLDAVLAANPREEAPTAAKGANDATPAADSTAPTPAPATAP